MYSAPCFSGDCGFCAACCDSEDDSSESEVIRRAEDLSKFFGPKKIDKITMNYNSKLKKWCKERGFRNPTDIGWTKETIKVTKKNGEEYILDFKIDNVNELLASNGQLHSNILVEINKD